MTLTVSYFARTQRRRQNSVAMPSARRKKKPQSVGSVKARRNSTLRMLSDDQPTKRRLGYILRNTSGRSHAPPGRPRGREVGSQNKLDHLGVERKRLLMWGKSFLAQLRNGRDTVHIADLYGLSEARVYQAIDLARKWERL